MALFLISKIRVKALLTFLFKRVDLDQNKEEFEMSILKEFERLTELAATKEGWQTIDDAYMIAANYEKIDGHWNKKGFRNGELAGFAIDVFTSRSDIGVYGGCHQSPTSELRRVLLEVVDCDRFDTYDRGIIEGRLAKIEGWENPLVMLLGRIDENVLKRVEEKILELNIGLPIRSICEKQFRA